MSILSWTFCNFDVVWKTSDFWSRVGNMIFSADDEQRLPSRCSPTVDTISCSQRLSYYYYTLYSYPSIIHVVVYVSISLEYSRSLGMFHLKHLVIRDGVHRCVISGKQLDFKGRSRWVKRCNFPRWIRDSWPCSDLVMFSPVSSCTFALETFRAAKVIYFAQIERWNVLYFFFIWTGLLFWIIQIFQVFTLLASFWRFHIYKYMPWKSLATVFYRLVSEFHHYFSRDLSSSEGTLPCFKWWQRLPGYAHLYIYAHRMK